MADSPESLSEVSDSSASLPGESARGLNRETGLVGSEELSSDEEAMRKRRVRVGGGPKALSKVSMH